ncbi:hypothetical protein ONZ45_g12614 [Pleurotus djamor]|nr:hypothetical protein ONZ45_g12614 [Pleurotus djamor]
MCGQGSHCEDVEYRKTHKTYLFLPLLFYNLIPSPISKRLRNKIAGFHPSHEKVQEEERERKDSYVPEVSALNVSASVGGLEVDSDTKDLLVVLNFADIPVTIVNTVHASQDRPRRERRNVPGAAPRA